MARRGSCAKARRGKPLLRKNALNYEENESSEGSNPIARQATVRKRPNGLAAEVVQEYKNLRQYFEQFLTVAIGKLEDETNSKLREVLKRIDKLERRPQHSS
jgi:hypothetical protein